MTRSTRHPLVRAIIRALDRAEQSERAHPNNGGTIRTTAGKIFEWGQCCERFNYPATSGIVKWSADAARAIVIAWALHCPDDELRWMADTAKDEIGWLDDWDRKGWYECHGWPVPRAKRRAA